MAWTRERLERLSQKQLHDLYQNAKNAKASQQAQAADLIRLIQDSGLPYSDPEGLKLDSPLGRQMKAIIFSPEGVAAAIAATERGLPALAGIDPLISEHLDKEYAETYEATIQAGYLVANMMRANGYFPTGLQAPIRGCVAKSGEVYRKR
ncbi:MAG TPA: hypothetical protein VMF67_18130 [Rhizomicrobium sp.]|nr:hypothetical protein [Rhizomicrobium sp.]